MSKFEWINKPTPATSETNILADELGVSPTLAKLLLQRGVKTFSEAKHYFRPTLNDLHDPFKMKDLRAAVELLSEVIDSRKRILVYGDYDVDGTMSVALVYGYLAEHTENISYYIPDRYTEGYGVSDQGVDFAIDNDIDLFITLDCGIKAVEKVQRLRDNGIDVIICDHHTPGEVVPNALILNPKQKDCTYPFKELPGCGVGFKLMEGLVRACQLDRVSLLDRLQIVAIAIAADIVSMTGENRVLCALGMNQLKDKPLPVFAKMLGKGEGQSISVSDLVFRIAPKINAAGRIKHASLAVELVLNSEEAKVEEILDEINALNQERRALDQEITKEALQQLREKNEENAPASIVWNKGWHKGVIGIVASRMIETYYKPTIVLTEKEGVLTGSARSVDDFDLYHALDNCSEHLIQFGGHKAAAGLTLDIKEIDSFKKAFSKQVELFPKGIKKTPELEIDSELDLKELHPRNGIPKFARILFQMQPFGPDNMTPHFVTRNAKAVQQSLRVVGEKHLKIEFHEEGKDMYALEGIAFNMGELFEEVLIRNFDIVYSLEVNHWNGKSKLQAMIQDIKILD